MTTHISTHLHPGTLAGATSAPTFPTDEQAAAYVNADRVNYGMMQIMLYNGGGSGLYLDGKRIGTIVQTDGDHVTDKVKAELSKAGLDVRATEMLTTIRDHGTSAYPFADEQRAFEARQARNLDIAAWNKAVDQRRAEPRNPTVWRRK